MASARRLSTLLAPKTINILNIRAHIPLRQVLLRSFTSASASQLTLNSKTISVPTGLFIDGEFVRSNAGNEFPVEDPSTGQELIRIQEGREEDVDAAVKVARRTFDDGSWTDSNPLHRAKLLNTLADVLEKMRRK